MDPHFIAYSATGNIIGVAYYPEFFDMEQFINTFDLRRRLKQLATRHNCDSVVVLIKTVGGSPLFETIVFEPNSADESGLFSTMCGNGIRAVAAYAQEHLGFTDWPLLLGTQSGILMVEKISDSIFRVRMGHIVTNKIALGYYINPAYFPENSELIDVRIHPDLLRQLPLPFSSNETICSIGFSSTESNPVKVDGEPQMVIELDWHSVQTIEDLRDIAQMYGSVICMNQNIFPLGINVNFIAPYPKDSAKFLISTFERNLGSDPKKCVTKSCGTGCTFAGAERIRKSGFPRVTAKCLGGELIIEKRNGDIFMSGEVSPSPS